MTPNDLEGYANLAVQEAFGIWDVVSLFFFTIQILFNVISVPNLYL